MLALAIHDDPAYPQWKVHFFDQGSNSATGRSAGYFYVEIRWLGLRCAGQFSRHFRIGRIDAKTDGVDVTGDRFHLAHQRVHAHE